MKGRTMEASISFIVLYCTHLDETVAFYQGLGLTFVREKHGKGPVHYACTVGPLVIELYPDDRPEETGYDFGAPPPLPRDPVRIGIEVADLKVVRKSHAAFLSREQGKSRDRLTLTDPSGNIVIVSQRP